MKKLKASLLVGLISLFAVSIFAVSNTMLQDSDKTIVAVEIVDLPEAVKETLANEKADWTATKASLVTKDGENVYKITLTKGDETKVISLTPDGKRKDK